MQVTKENGTFPQYSADGKKVYFLRDVTGGTDIFALDVSSNDVTQVSKGLNPITAISCSPDGKTIAFASRNELKDRSSDAGNVWILDLESGRTKRLTDGGKDQYPRYSPNGQHIAFQRQEGVYAQSTLKAYKVVVIAIDPVGNGASEPPPAAASGPATSPAKSGAATLPAGRALPKADTVMVIQDGISANYGKVAIIISPDGKMTQGPRPEGPVKVAIWRNLHPGERNAAAKLGIVPGKAYLVHDDGAHEFLCDVDLTLSNEKLASKFGVNVEKGK